MRCELCLGAAIVWPRGAHAEVCPSCGGTGRYVFVSLRDPALWLRGARLVPDASLGAAAAETVAHHMRSADARPVAPSSRFGDPSRRAGDDA